MRAERPNLVTSVLSGRRENQGTRLRKAGRHFLMCKSNVGMSHSEV